MQYIFITLGFIYVIYFIFVGFLLIEKTKFINESWKKGYCEPIFYFVSFTLLHASYTKFLSNYWDNTNKKCSMFFRKPLIFIYKEILSHGKANLIKKYNFRYIIITILIFICCAIFSIDNKETILLILFYAASCFYAFSRVNEIFFAFIRDARSQLSPQSNSSGLKYYERIKLAMVSYIELIFLYGILQFVISVYGYGINNSNCSWIANISDAVYFSGITMATIGYGDLYPISLFSKFLAVYEVINGLVLIVISFTIYVSRSIIDEEYKNKNFIKAKIYQGEQSGFVAECIELPIVTQGQTLDEVVKNLREAISLHLEGEDLAALGFAPHPPIVINYEMESVCS